MRIEILKNLRRAFLCLALAFVACDEGPIGQWNDITFVKQNGERTAIIRVEVAATPEARAKGLKFRAHPGTDRGLLLLYPIPGDYLVSNENVPDPVDFAFLAPNGQLLGVVQNVSAQDSSLRTIGAPSSAVIILGAGVAQQLGISRGDMALIQGPPPKAS